MNSETIPFNIQTTIDQNALDLDEFWPDIEALLSSATNEKQDGYQSEEVAKDQPMNYEQSAFITNEQTHSLSLFFGFENVPINDEFNNDSSFPLFVGFEGSINTELPFKTDKRRYNKLQNENETDLIINLKNISPDLREIIIELTLITRYEGNYYRSAFGFDTADVNCRYKEIYYETIRLRDVVEGQSQIILNSVNVYKLKNQYFKNPKGNPGVQYRLEKYPSKEELLITSKQRIKRFIDDHGLHLVRLAVRFFNASSNEPLPIVGDDVQGNILLSNILSIQKPPIKSKKETSSNDQTKSPDTNAATTSPMNNDVFDALFTSNNFLLDNAPQIELLPTALQGDPVYIDESEQMEQTTQKIQNSSQQTRQSSKKTKQSATQSVDLGPSVTKKRKTSNLKRIVIKVKNLADDDEPISIDVSPTDQIQRLKYQLAQLWNIPVEKQCLIPKPGETLDDEKTLEDYQIGNGDLIFLA